MNITNVGNNIIVEGLECFDIEQTIECGQCFHYDKVDEKEYVIVAYQKVLHIRQELDKLIFFQTDSKDFEQIWRPYLDLDRDYKKIQQFLIQNEYQVCGKNSEFKEAVEQMNGIRILNQDFLEVLMSFIISQNKNITHIRQIVELISRKYGTQVDIIKGKEYYAFPNLSVLSEITEHEFRLCKTGFRAPYLVDACKQIQEGTISEQRMRQANEDAVIKELMCIKGVGSKVANCVALFGLGKRSAFPVDVWVKRIMEKLYFEVETDHIKISEFAKEVFGEYGGYAQQYLFHYGRSNGWNEKHGWLR